jgi:integrase
MALEIIDSIPRREGADFLFGKQKGFVNWGNAKAALDKLVGAMDPWTVHDLRRTLSTGMHEHGIADPHVVESILNHVSGHKAGTAGTYNQATYRAQIAQAMARWADHVHAVTTGAPAKVVTLKRSA